MPVSYTHLDVYKRQEVQGMIDIMDEKIHWEDGVVLPNKEVATEFLKKERETLSLIHI